MLDRSRVREVYAEAAAMPVGARAAHLDLRCAGDAALREEVESLLASAAERPGFLDTPTAAPTGPAQALGTRIGHYRLLQEIGQGGFGSVYMAEQEEPVRRRVAVKVIKMGMDTRAVIARFEAERQALALMDHANIARVYDAGATEAGRPYFVMELVRGDAITAYCDRNSLSIPERLGIFVQVCQAVQHAHAKGVIHRDLKPGNVLVATEDGRAHAKVIDFGIAKATEQGLTEGTLFTDFRQFVGTPEYMSPEQAQGSLNVDTRSDVYSLGVLLYELLTGATPFDARTLRSGGCEEFQRIVRDVEPPKPSTRLSQSAALAQVAEHRRTEPARLSALVRGDLDWIVMKALEKDRARRYDTASALAADIGRHLAREPVEAAPPSRAYRLRTFVRRNRGLVAAGVAVSAALVLGVIGTSIGLVLANSSWGKERVQREAAQTNALRALAAEQEAVARAGELERVAAFQADQLKDLIPQEMGSQLRADVLAETRAWLERTEPDETARSARMDQVADSLTGTNFTNVALRSLQRNIFERAIRTIDRDFADQPRLRARLLHRSGVTMIGLGLYEEALDPLTRAMESFAAEGGAEHPETLSARSSLGWALLQLGRVTEAAEHIRAAFETQRRELPPGDPDMLMTMVHLGWILRHEGKLSEAEATYREALDQARRVFGEEHPDTLAMLSHVARIVREQGRPAEAEPMLRRGLELSTRIHGKDHLLTHEWINRLRDSLDEQGKLGDTDPNRGVELVESARRTLGDDHPGVTTALNNAGADLLARDRAAEAEGYFREARERHRRGHDGDRRGVLGTFNNLGSALRKQGKLDEAERVLAEGVAASASDDAAVWSTRAKLLHHYAEVLKDLRRAEEARPPALEAVQMYRDHPDWSPYEAYHAAKVLREIMVQLGDAAGTEAAIRDLLRLARLRQPMDEKLVAFWLARLGSSLNIQRRFTESETLLRECLEIRLRVFPDDHPDAWVRANTMTGLGVALIGQAQDESLDREARLAKLREAESLVRNGYTGVDNPHAVNAGKAEGQDLLRYALRIGVYLYETWERLEPGVGHGEQAAEWSARIAAPAERP